MAKSANPTPEELSAFLEAAGISTNGLDDLVADALAAGIEEVESRTGYQWIADEEDTAYTYTPEPTGRDGRWRLPDVFYTITSLAFQPQGQASPTAWTLGTDYYVQRYDAAATSHIEALTLIPGFSAPVPYTYQGAITITGRRGRGLTMPTEVWAAMLQCAAVRVYAPIQEARSKGLTSWKDEAGRSVTFGAGAFVGIRAESALGQWKGASDAVIRRYMRRFV